MCLWVTSQYSLTRKSSTLSHTHPALAEYLPWAPMNQHFTCQPFNNDMNVHVNALWCPTAAVFHPPTPPPKRWPLSVEPPPVPWPHLHQFSSYSAHNFSLTAASTLYQPSWEATQPLLSCYHHSGEQHTMDAPPNECRPSSHENTVCGAANPPKNDTQHIKDTMF